MRLCTHPGGTRSVRSEQLRGGIHPQLIPNLHLFVQIAYQPVLWMTMLYLEYSRTDPTAWPHLAAVIKRVK